MKTLETKSSESSLHDGPTGGDGEPTGRTTSNDHRRDLSPAELAALMERVEALAPADGDIDYSDIPPMTDEQLAGMVRGPWTERVVRTVTLTIDDEVAAWLEENAVKQSYLINLVLKREAQRDKRRKAAGAMEKAS